MQVYIEDAILQNLVINYMLLSISDLAINEKPSKIKLFLVALFGALFAVVISLFQISLAFLIPIKILCAIMITLFMSKGNNIKNFLLFFLVFLSMTFVMGGGVVSLQNLFEKNLSGLSIVFIIFGLYIILKNIFKQFYLKQKLSKFYYDINLSKGDNFCKIKAYLDSGNLLVDAKTGLSILIVNYSTLEKLYRDKITVVDYLQQNLDKKLEGRYIECKTIGGVSKVFVCKIDKVVMSSGEKIDVMIGVGKGLNNKNYQGLLSPLAI